jgi:hypothetical protein
VLYSAAHRAIRKVRGPARSYKCAKDCGRMAKEWSYDYSDPNELIEVRNGKRYTYSLDVNHYRPLCMACHRASDLRIPYDQRDYTGPTAPVVAFETVQLAPIVFHRPAGALVNLRKPPEWTGVRRRCSVCRMVKDEGAFLWRSAKRERRTSRCRYCDSGISRERYRATRARTAADRARNAEVSRRSYERNRARAVEVYGGRCAWCGATADLEFDHPNNDGGAHRAVETVASMYARISKTGAPLPDWSLQLLCVPCHRGWAWKERRSTATPATDALAELRAMARRV